MNRTFKRSQRYYNTFRQFVKGQFLTGLSIHEVGHALWLEEALDKNNPQDLPVPGVTYGVMLNKGDLSLHLVNDNDKFTISNLQTIQAMGLSVSVENGGPGDNRPK